MERIKKRQMPHRMIKILKMMYFITVIGIRSSLEITTPEKEKEDQTSEDITGIAETEDQLQEDRDPNREKERIEKDIVTKDMTTGRRIVICREVSRQFL